MTATTEQRLHALREAISRQHWDSFRTTVAAWADEEPENPWLAAGVSLSHVIEGEELTDERWEALAAVDERVANQVSALANLRAGNAEEARNVIVEELAADNRSDAWVSAYKAVTKGTDDVNRHLFSAQNLIAGCVIRDGQIQSMAAKGSRMSADSVGHRADQIWNEIGKLNKRVNLGTIRSVQVVAEDGGWILVSDNQEPPRLASALIASPDATHEAMARAQVALHRPEAAE